MNLGFCLAFSYLYIKRGSGEMSWGEGVYNLMQSSFFP